MAEAPNYGPLENKLSRAWTPLMDAIVTSMVNLTAQCTYAAVYALLSSTLAVHATAKKAAQCLEARS